MYLGHLLTNFVQIWHADSLLATVLSCFVAFTFKGQTKDAVAFKGIYHLLTDFVQIWCADSFLATVLSLFPGLEKARI